MPPQTPLQHAGMMEKCPNDNLNQTDQKLIVDITVEEIKEAVNTSNKAGASKNYKFNSKHKRIKRKRMWQVLESISKDVTDYADRQLAVEVANTWGRLDTQMREDSPKEKKLQQALLKWRDWLHTKAFAHMGSPVFYKCLTCSKGWWRLHPFREHIETHKEVLKIKLETTYYESSIVAYVGNKPLKTIVHIDGNCLKCSKGMKEHRFYRCYVCQFAFGNCTALYRHDCRKMLNRRGVILELVKLEICSICGYKCRSLEMDDHMSLIHTVPSDEPVDFSTELHSDCGTKDVSNDLHVSPTKVRKFHEPTLSRLLKDIADSDIMCQSVVQNTGTMEKLPVDNLKENDEKFTVEVKEVKNRSNQADSEKKKQHQSKQKIINRKRQNTNMMEKLPVDNLLEKDQKFTVEVKEVKNRSNQADSEKNQYQSKQKIINRKRMWQVLESISKDVTDYADRQLAVEVANTWGRLDTQILEDSPKEKKLQQALLKWRDWLRTKAFAHMGSPVFYKCLTCSKGWWRLHPFREHIETHKEVLKIKLETTYFESSIVAYVGNKPLKTIVHIDGNCLKCSKGMKEHRFYRCYVCQFAFGNCTALYRHDCKKMQSRRGVILESVKLEICSICGYKCRSLEMYDHMSLIHTVPSDEPVDFSTELHSDCGMKYVSHDLHACPTRAREIYCNYCPRKFDNSTLLRLHNMDIVDNNIECQICSELLPKQCMLMEHLSAHSEHFAMVPKCSLCTFPVVFPDDVSAKYHMKAWHDKIETRNRTFHDMVIIPKIVVKKWRNIDSMDPYTIYKEEDALSDDETNEVVQINHFNGILQNNTEAHADFGSYNGKTDNIDISKNFDLDQEMIDDETNKSIQSDRVNNILQKNTETYYINTHKKESVYNGILKNGIDKEMSNDETNVKSNRFNGVLQNNTKAHTEVGLYNGKTINFDILNQENDLDQEMKDDETNESVQSKHVNNILQNNKETDTYLEKFNEKSFNNDMLKNDLDQEMCDNEKNENFQSKHVNNILQNNKETHTYVEKFNEKYLDQEMCDNETNESVQRNHFNGILQENKEAHTVGLA